MSRKRTIAALAGVTCTAIAVGAASAAGGSPQGSLLIRHQLRGCHSWAFDGGAFKSRQTLAVKLGSTIVVTNNDVMPHTLIQTAGPAAVLRQASMSHPGAVARIVFPHKGAYAFTTKAGEDYVKGVKTIGPDNVLRLKVVVG